MRKQLISDKRGIGLEEVKGIILLLIILGLLIGVGLYVLGELRYKVDVSESYENINETLKAVNHTGTPIANDTYRDCSLSNVVCVNESFEDAENSVIATENYTVIACSIYLTPTTVESAGFNNSLWNCTGTVSYSIDKEASSGVMNATLATNDLATWLSLIVIVLAASIVLYVVAKSFGGGVS